MTKTQPDKQQWSKSQIARNSTREVLRREGEIVFADDGVIITEHGAPEQIAQKLLNYGATAQSRKLWGQLGKSVYIKQKKDTGKSRNRPKIPYAN